MGRSPTLLVVLLAAAAGCLDDGGGPAPAAPPPSPSPVAAAPPPPATPPAAPDPLLKTLDYAYEPLRLEVSPGANVTVINEGKEPHTVTAVERTRFDADVAVSGTVRFVAPTQPGTYRFYCVYHAGPGAEPGKGMAGDLVVR